MPVPASDTLCGLPVALSVIIKEPGRVPKVVGWKATVTTQLDPGFKDAPQLFVWVKSAVVCTFDRMMGSEPLFDNVTDFEELAVPTTVIGNERLDADTLRVKATPVPLSETT